MPLPQRRRIRHPHPGQNRVLRLGLNPTQLPHPGPSLMQRQRHGQKLMQRQRLTLLQRLVLSRNLAEKSPAGVLARVM